MQDTVDKILQDEADVQAATKPLNKTKYPYYRVDAEGNHVEMTQAEYKKAMRKEFTVQHKRIPMCGHKFVPGNEPRHRNCEHCWFVFFQVHGELTQSVEEVYQKHGKIAVIRLRGPKFLHNFLRFMSTVAAYKEAVEKAKKEEKDVSTVGTQSSNEGPASYGNDDEGEYTTYAEQDRLEGVEPEAGIAD